MLTVSAQVQVRIQESGQPHVRLTSMATKLKEPRPDLPVPAAPSGPEDFCPRSTSRQSSAAPPADPGGCSTGISGASARRRSHLLLQVRQRPFATISATVLISLGLVVMAGWLARVPAIVQLYPGLAPMQFNTALGFLLLGIGFFGVLIDRTVVAATAGGAAALLGGVTLLQYLTGSNFGIDQLFLEHDITTRTSHLGRMAPNTTLGFLYAGLALMTLLSRRHTHRALAISGVLGALTASLAAAALGGYLLRLEAAYGWGDLTAMAGHTAAGFLLAGTSLFGAAWLRSSQIGRPKPLWLPLCAGFAVLAVTLVLWQAISAEEARVYGGARTPPAISISDILPVFGIALAIAITAAVTFALRAQRRAALIQQEMIAKEAAQARILTAEASAAESRRQLRDAMEHATVQIGIFGPDEQLQVCNQAYWNSFFPGRPIPKQLPTFRELLETSLTSNLIPGLLNASEEKRLEWIEGRMATFREGKRNILRQLTDGHWLSIQQQRLPDGGMIIIQTDVTEVKDHEQQVIRAARAREEAIAREAEQRAKADIATRQLVDAIAGLPAGVAIFDADNRLVQANDAYRRNFPAAAQDWKTPPTYADLCRAGDGGNLAVGAENDPEVVAARAEQQIAWFEGDGSPVELQLKDGRWLTIQKSVLSGGGSIVVETDITELKAREDALVASNKELARFAYVASHDLQEPLRKIRTFGGMIRSRHGEELSETSADYLQRMQGAAERMQSLIHDLLEFSRAQQGDRHFEQVDLKLIASQVLEDLEQQIADAGANVEVGDLPTIEADRTHMRQLIQNLVSNAIKFRHKDRKPEISIEWANPPGRQGEMSPVPEIVVRDNGIGIEPKHRRRIFEVFQRLHGRTEYEGTGVGLAVCRRIAERMGGRIRAEANPGGGSAFRVFLPARQNLEIL